MTNQTRLNRAKEKLDELMTNIQDLMDDAEFLNEEDVQRTMDELEQIRSLMDPPEKGPSWKNA